jgi:hypothetical protein
MGRVGGSRSFRAGRAVPAASRPLARVRSLAHAVRTHVQTPRGGPTRSFGRDQLLEWASRPLPAAEAPASPPAAGDGDSRPPPSAPRPSPSPPTNQPASSPRIRPAQTPYVGGSVTSALTISPLLAEVAISLPELDTLAYSTAARCARAARAQLWDLVTRSLGYPDPYALTPSMVLAVAAVLRPAYVYQAVQEYHRRGGSRTQRSRSRSGTLKAPARAGSATLNRRGPPARALALAPRRPTAAHGASTAWNLPASKADPRALGERRAHLCACGAVTGTHSSCRHRRAPRARYGGRRRETPRPPSSRPSPSRQLSGLVFG